MTGMQLQIERPAIRPVSRCRETGKNPWFSAHGTPDLRLFCFPYAGGGASIYRGWQDAMPAGVEVCPIQLPGRETRIQERPYRRIGAIVEALADAMAPYLDTPFAFFGHSMGARISFELARCLRKRYGVSPEHLFASGAPAPHVVDTDPTCFDMPDDQFIAELRRLNGTRKEVLDNPELMEMMLPMLRADFEVVETYRYHAGTPLNCRITALGGLADETVPRAAVEQWAQHTSSRFALRFFPGGHFFVNTARASVVRIIAGECERLTLLEGQAA